LNLVILADKLLVIFIKSVTIEKGWFLRIMKQKKKTKMTFDHVSKSILFLLILFN